MCRPCRLQCRTPIGLRMYQGLQQWKGGAIAGTPDSLRSEAATGVPSAGREGRLRVRDGFDEDRSPLYYIIPAIPLLIRPNLWLPEVLHSLLASSDLLFAPTTAHMRLTVPVLQRSNLAITAVMGRASCNDPRFQPLQIPGWNLPAAHMATATRPYQGYCILATALCRIRDFGHYHNCRGRRACILSGSLFAARSRSRLLSQDRYSSSGQRRNL